MTGSAPLLSFENLSYLANGPYSLDVWENETVGLTGPSGIGKTQLFRAIVDTLPHGGEVMLSGRSSLSFPVTEWRKKIALVPAESVWWYESVGEHFQGQENIQKAKIYLMQLGFQEDVLNWQISRLSSGERQRLALVRSLLQDPVILLLDEPSSALDRNTTEKMEHLLQNYVQSKGTAMLIISHDMEQLHRISDRLFIVSSTGLEEMLVVS